MGVGISKLLSKIMQFNDSITEQGIVQDVYFEVGANANSYPIASLVRHANQALDMATELILSADGKWQFDSKNATNLLIGYADLVSGQQDYSFDDEFLVINKPIQILNPDGVNWTELVPSDDTELVSQNGVPYQYNKLGSSFLLDPIPNYNWRFATEGKYGIKVYFQRKIDYFTASDTDKEPGFATPLHPFVSVYCQYRYAKSKGLAKLPQIEKDLLYYTGNIHLGGNTMGAIQKHYATRGKDQERGISISNPVII